MIIQDILVEQMTVVKPLTLIATTLWLLRTIYNPALMQYECNQVDLSVYAC